MATYKHLRSGTANKRPTTSIADGQLAINTNTASPGLFFKDSAGTGIVKVGPVHVGTTAPNSSPAVGGSTGNYLGEQWLDTSVSPAQMKVWNGSTWVGVVADELPVSKLQDGAARQLIQTDAAGTGVEWTSNVDVPGTLDVTSTATFDSIAQHPLGTAAAPTITFTGDTNTGVYSPGADQVAISTGGTGRLFIDASGNVLINDLASVTSNVSAYLRIRQVNPAADTSIAIINAQNSDADATVKIKAGQAARNGGEIVFGRENGLDWNTFTSADGYIAFSPVLDNANTERVRIDSSGRLLVGTSSALSSSVNDKLQIAAASATGVSTNQSIYSFNTGGGASSLSLTRSNSATLGVNTLVASGQTLGFVNFSGADGSTYINAARIIAEVDGTPGVNDMPGRLVFSVTRDGQASLTEAMRINNAGTTTLTSAASTAPFIANIGASEVARIDSSGRLLVGTSSSSRLVTQILQGNSTSATTQSVLFFARGSASPAINQALGVIEFGDSNHDAAASVAARRDTGTWTPGVSHPGRLELSTTADGASSPTERLRITNDGVQCYDQAAPVSYAAAATLVIGDLKNGLVQYTGAAANLTLPTGTLTEGGFSGIYTNMTFEWSVINTGSGTCTIGNGTGHTVTGSATVAAGASGRFASRRTAANTFVSYRLS
jgi:hypothetical protein